MFTKSVFTRLIGGLGNQLFQYAAGRAAAQRLRAKLIVDTRYIPDPDLLTRFGDVELIDKSPKMPPHKRQRASYLLWRSFAQQPKLLREFKNFRWGDPFPDGDIYLHGYWQERRLVKEASLELKSPENLILPRRDPNEVCVHVRGGDYLALKSRRQHKILGADYYNKAIADLRAKLGEIRVTVFTNDQTHAKSLGLNFTYNFAAPEMEGDAVTCLWAMAQFQNFVIANSTFSWWASYLAGPEAFVIEPEEILVR